MRLQVDSACTVEGLPGLQPMYAKQAGRNQAWQMKVLTSVRQNRVKIAQSVITHGPNGKQLRPWQVAHV